MGAETSFTSSQCTALAQAFPIPALRKGREERAPTVSVMPARSKAWAIRPVTHPLGKILV
jgi:hypothetical protein